MIGALVVALVSILNLIALDLWFGFGSPWPIAMLWAVCGWSKLGANLATACLIFVLGCWIDLLTGSALGTWAFTGLATLAIMLAADAFLGVGSVGPVVSCSLAGAVMILIMTLVGYWQSQQFYFLGNVASIAVAISLYPFVFKLFELTEDEI